MASNEKEYYESLVHPAMFTHPKPINVAIIGGGDGGAVRETLKHNTIQSINVIEKDSLLIDVAREYLSTISDCSDIEGASSICFDDEHVNMIFDHVKVLYEEHYGTIDNDGKSSIRTKFDLLY